MVKRLNLQMANHISPLLVSSNEVVHLPTPQSLKMTMIVSNNEVKSPLKL
jgi:hypothetical protein